jgi:patatin-like phospholipase/acyl hydrolase
MKTLEDHIKGPGPKRILALDGGGIRGALTLGYLKKIETILRKQQKDDSLVLSDYFDLIGGTSTGAIIAAALAIGKTVDEIAALYMKLGGVIFGEKKNWWNPFETLAYLKAGYSYRALEQNLKEVFKNITLDGKEVKTGLCVVAKRADTNSTWPLINHPEGIYFENNRNIPLWQVVRASTAAPTYFAPQLIDVGKGELGAFVDGGVSMCNNPGLLLLTVATLKGFKFNWSLGEENLMLVSVGTGYSIFRKHNTEITDSWMLSWAKTVPDMLMQDASWQNQVILQWLSNSPTACHIDTEMGDLKNDFLGGKPLIKYLRYNFPITQNDLNGLKLGRDFTEGDVKDITEMSNAHNKELLYEIGKAAAEKEVMEAHF